jgi:predicted enzyme related to lactoylglutathione lyase
MFVLINIDVPDLQTATNFYTAAFGLRLGRRFGQDAVELLGWPSPLYLLRKTPGTIGAAGQPRTYTRHWTPVHLDVVVDDIDIALARAIRAGALVEERAGPTAYGKIAMLSDPFGHGICLIQFKGRGYDEISALDTAPNI